MCGYPYACAGLWTKAFRGQTPRLTIFIPCGAVDVDGQGLDATQSAETAVVPFLPGTVQRLCMCKDEVGNGLLQGEQIDCFWRLYKMMGLPCLLKLPMLSLVELSLA